MPIIDLPTPGDDEDVWGTKLNVAISAINAAVDDLITGLTVEQMPPGSMVKVIFTGLGEPTRPPLPADTYVLWQGPFFPAAALVGDDVDLRA